jgi:integrase
MAHIEKRHRKPCAREDCGHGFAKHGGSAKGACTRPGCGCSRWITAPGDPETIRARWRDPSGRERNKTFTRMLDANRFLLSIEDAKLRGAYVDPAAGKVAFGKWAERWYASTAHLKPSTRHDYRALLDNQILPTFRGSALAAIDTLAVKEWRSGLLAGDPDATPPRAPLSPKRAGKALQVLSQVLGSAVEGGRLSVNRAAGVKPPKVQRKEMHFLDADQVEALADAIHPRYRALVLFAAYTGLRPCEQVALRVGRLDLLGCTARVAEAAVEVERLEWGPVKTHEARTVRMPRSVAEEIGAQLAGRPLKPEDLVFTAPMGGPLDRAGFVKSYFKPAVRAANEALAQLPRDQRPAPLPEGLRLYDLRHTCASLLIAQGASVKAVQKQLGHATASITLDTYGHLFPSEMEALGERLEAVRDAARTRRPRPQGGPVVVPMRETAGRQGGG